MGCFGKIQPWFIKRKTMPKICGDNLCFNMDLCYKVSFKKLNGYEPDSSYSFSPSKYRVRS